VKTITATVNKGIIQVAKGDITAQRVYIEISFHIKMTLQSLYLIGRCYNRKLIIRNFKRSNYKGSWR
jgi:hypothetical protein